MKPRTRTSPTPTLAALLATAMTMAMATVTATATLLAPTPAHAQDADVSLGDAALADLLRTALRDNISLDAARARIAQSEAIALQNLSPVLPQISVNAGINLSPYGDSSPGAFANSLDPNHDEDDDPDAWWSASATVDLALQADIFGKQALSHQASLRDARASRKDRRSIAHNVAVTVAEAWFDIASTQARLDVVSEQRALQESLLSVTRLRFESGEASGLDVAQQQQQVAAIAAAEPQLRSLLRQRIEQLGALLGADPAAPLAVAPTALPELVALPPELSQPATASAAPDTAADRPDLAAAATRLDASRLRKQSAIHGFFPKLRVSAQAGVQATYIEEWEDDLIWGIGASLSLPLFDGLATPASVRQASAAEYAARRDLDQAARDAVFQRNSALVREQELRIQRDAVTNQVVAARFAFEQSRDRYVVGLAPYSSVLLASNALQQAELSGIQVHRDLLSARIALLQAVGSVLPEGARAGGSN